MTASKFGTLASALIRQIENKMFQHGEKLPAIRTLMAEHRVSKNTVIRALIELEKFGYISARPRLGFFVTFKPPENKPPQTLATTLQAVEVSIPQMFFEIMSHSAAFDILPSAKEQYQSKHLLQLNRDLSRAAKQQPFIKASYYDSPIGLQSLRLQIKDRYRSRGLVIDEADLCITSGCQHALFLSLFTVCKPGDNVAVESPGFYGVIQLLEQLKLNIIEIPASPVIGLDLDALKSALDKWQISAVVVTPSFSTPTGAVMSVANRKALVAIANEHDFALIEDDIYGELAFDSNTNSENHLPLKAFDSQDRVILCSSFSKSLSRDLRIGWIAGGRWHKDIIRLKLTSQLASSRVQQEAIAEFMLNGHFKRHIASFSNTLLNQRNQLLAAILQYWPNSVKYTLPQGGLALWVEFSDDIDTTKLYAKALEQNITLTPGQLFSCSGHYKNCLRVSFNHPFIGERLNALKTINSLISRIYTIPGNSSMN